MQNSPFAQVREFLRQLSFPCLLITTANDLLPFWAQAVIVASFLFLNLSKSAALSRQALVITLALVGILGLGVLTQYFSNYPENGYHDNFILLAGCGVAALSISNDAGKRLVSNDTLAGLAIAALGLTLLPLWRSILFLRYFGGFHGASAVAFRSKIPTLFIGHSASFSSIVPLLLLPFLLVALARKNTSLPETLLHAIGVYVLAAYLLSTMLRINYLCLIGYAICSIVVALRTGHKRFYLAIALTVLLLSATVYLARIRVTGVIGLAKLSSDRSVQGRLRADAIALSAIRRHPFLGLGPGNYVFAITDQLRTMDHVPLIGRPYNIGLDLVVSFGLLIILQFMVISAITIRQCYIARSNSGSSRPAKSSYDGVLFLAGLGICLLHEMTISSFLATSTAAMLVAFLWAAIYNLYWHSVSETAHRSVTIRPTTGKWRAGVLITMFVAIATPIVAGWLRHRYGDLKVANALADFNAKQYARGSTELAAAMQIDPGNAYIHVLSGLGNVRQRTLSSSSLVPYSPHACEVDPLLREARKQFKEAVHLNPDDVTATLDLAITDYGCGERDDAARLLEAARRLEPDDPVVYMTQAIIAAPVADRNNGIHNLRLAVAAAPRVLRSKAFNEAAKHMGITSQVVAMWALSDLKSSYVDNKSPRILAKIATLQYFIGLDQAADDSALTVLREEPTIAVAWNVHAALLLRKAEYFEAKNAFLMASIADPMSIDAHIGLCAISSLEHKSSSECVLAASMQEKAIYHNRDNIFYEYQTQYIYSDDVVPNGYLRLCCFPEGGDIGSRLTAQP